MARKSTKSVPAPATGKSGYAIGVKRTEAEWDELCQSVFIPAREAGTTMTDLRSQYGRSKFIRNALRRAGRHDLLGVKRGNDAVGAKARKQTLINFIVKQRQNGEGWDGLELKSGKTRTELKKILTEAGHGDLAIGRVQLRVKQDA